MTTHVPPARFNLSAICLALSAIALGHAIQIANGFYDEAALAWLSVAIAVAVAGMFVQKRSERGPSHRSETVVRVILACGIAWQIRALLTAKPGMYVTDAANMTLFTSAVAVQGAFIALGLSRLRAFSRLWFPGVLVASLALGVWMIKESPEPLIDVVVVHREALDALIEGKDPYRISFTNIYERADTELFYNPNALFGNRIAQAYPYPPPSLLLALPGHVLLGDYRYSELAFLILGAALVGFTRSGVVGKFAACLLLTTPRIWFVIEQGWTEPIAIFLLALTVFLLVRSQIAAGWAGGLLIVTKQYMGFTGLALLRLCFLERRRWVWTAFGATVAAAAATLPFALWHPNAFFRSIVLLQTLEPFRIDSLSYLSLAARHGLGNGSYVWAVGAAVAAAALSLASTRNTPVGFATSVAVTTLFMFAFGSKAFCNYYFFVIGALCCAVAAFPEAGVDEPASPEPAPL